MRALTTEMFRILTPAAPSCVWGELTTTGERVEHAYGAAVDSTWQQGDIVHLGVRGAPPAVGRVLRADPPRLLSYTLGDTEHDPAVYVTWELDAHPEGTVLRLYVDEPGQSEATEIEQVWLPVLTTVERRLASCRGPR